MGGRRLLGDLLHGVGAFGDPPDLSAHLVHRGGRGLHGLLEIRRAPRHLLDGRAHLRDGRRGLLVVTRELVDLEVDAADRGVDVGEQGGGLLDGGLLVLRALIDLGHGLRDLLGQTLKIPGEAAHALDGPGNRLGEVVQGGGLGSEVAHFIDGQPIVHFASADRPKRHANLSDPPARSHHCLVDDDGDSRRTGDRDGDGASQVVPQHRQGGGARGGARDSHGQEGERSAPPVAAQQFGIHRHPPP